MPRKVDGKSCQIWKTDYSFNGGLWFWRKMSKILIFHPRELFQIWGKLARVYFTILHSEYWSHGVCGNYGNLLTPLLPKNSWNQLIYYYFSTVANLMKYFSS